MSAISRAATPRPERRGLSRLTRLNHRRIGLVLVVLLLLATLVAAQMINDYQAGRRAMIGERFGTRHTTATHFINAYVAQILTQQGKLGEELLYDPITPERFDEIARQSQFSSSVLLDAQGQLLAASPPNAAQVGTSVGLGYAYLRLALAGQRTVSDVVPATSGREPVIDFAVPFRSRSGRRVISSGYAIADTPLQPFVMASLATYRTANVYLIDSSGTVITSNRTANVGLRLERVAPVLADQLGGQPIGFLGAGEDRRYYRSGPVVGTGWRLIFELDTDELYQSLTPSQVRTPWLVLAGFLVMGLGIIVLFTRALAGRSRAEGEHARQEAILDTAGDAFIGMDAGGLITDWNTAAVQLLGWTRAEALGRPVATLIVPARQRDAHTTGLKTFLGTGVPQLPTHPITLGAQHRDGHEIPVELTVSRSHWDGTWRFHGFMRDITERIEHENQLNDLALTDSLTGLANRRAFLERLDQAHARARRHGTELGVLYADVDQFKTINDTYGHAAGDAVLCEIGDRMRALFRTEDTIGRLGGDEFAVVCEDFDATATELTERLRRALAIPYTFREQTILATVSVGVASPSVTEIETVERLLERADTSMYLAKATQRAGR